MQYYSNISLIHISDEINNVFSEIGHANYSESLYFQNRYRCVENILLAYDVYGYYTA